MIDADDLNSTIKATYQESERPISTVIIHLPLPQFPLSVINFTLLQGGGRGYRNAHSTRINETMGKEEENENEPISASKDGRTGTAIR